MPGTLSPLTEWTGGEEGLGVLPVSGSCEWVSDSIPVVHLQDDLLPPVSSSERESSLPKDTQLGSTEPGDQPRGPRALILATHGLQRPATGMPDGVPGQSHLAPHPLPPAPLGAWETGGLPEGACAQRPSRPRASVGFHHPDSSEAHVGTHLLRNKHLFLEANILAVKAGARMTGE